MQKQHPEELLLHKILILKQPISRHHNQQRLSTINTFSKTRLMTPPQQAEPDLQRKKPTKNHSGPEKPVEYAILIKHNRPDYNKVEFVSTYYTSEKKDKKSIKQIFTKAFRIAHPSWKIKKITVIPAITNAAQQE